MPTADLWALYQMIGQRLAGSYNQTENAEKYSIIGQELRARESALFPPEKVKQWQYRTKQEISWKNCSDEEYEQMHHLSRFEFQQIDV